jgi:preprotein translocase subunit YajC
MEFFALTALAQENVEGTSMTGAVGGQNPEQQTPGISSMLTSFMPMILIVAVFYFVMIAPERKQRKKREAMLAAVKKGDKVLTTGGMFASVAAVNEDSVTLLAADDVRLKFSRTAIAQVIEVEGGDS